MIRRGYFGFTLLPALTALFSLTFAGISRAAEMIPGASAKKGAFEAHLTHRAPISTREQIAARFGGRAATLPDYDPTKETFDVYVPADPGPDGKYGLMIAQNYGDIGKPPTAWTAVLDAHHLIWMGAQRAGDGAGTAKRIGLMLDAVYNAEGTWNVDPNRVFCFISSAESPACGAPLYFPDVFVGSVHCHLMQWFHNIQNGKDKQLAPWQFGKLPKIKSPQLELAQSRRYYIIDRLEENHVGGQDPNADVMNNGFIRDGYPNVKMGAAETHIGNKYMDCSAEWFEPAVAYIDIPPEQPAIAMSSAPTETAANAKQQPGARGPNSRGQPTRGSASADTSSKQSTPPATAAPPPPPPAVADDPAAKAARALSLAKSYITAERYDAARDRLQQLIKTYPDTPAAKDAKTLLDQIKDK